jgi:hypothetical protein
MKITKSQLKEIIKKELNEFGYAEPGDEELYRELIQKIGSSEDFDQLLYVINRLGVEEEQVLLDLGAAAHGREQEQVH